MSRLIESLLFGVRPTDAATIAAVVAIIAAVAAIACGLLAWRASRLDLIVVLRLTSGSFVSQTSELFQLLKRGSPTAQ